MPNPRIRSIRPEFYDDKKIAKISIQARFMYIGLISFADDNGNVCIDPAWLRSRVFPREDVSLADITTWVNELIDKKFIAPYEANGDLHATIRNFLKHQKINRPNRDPKFCFPMPENSLNFAENEDSVNVHVQITDDVVTEKEMEVEKEREMDKDSTSYGSMSADADFKQFCDKIISLWNSLDNPPFSAIRSLTDDRRKRLRTRYGDKQFAENIETIIKKIGGSEFCRGKTNWVASFDWLIKNGNNYVKVLEGKYDDRAEGNSGRTNTSGNPRHRGFDPEAAERQLRKEFGLLQETDRAALPGGIPDSD